MQDRDIEWAMGSKVQIEAYARTTYNCKIHPYVYVDVIEPQLVLMHF
jgi:hypothetical protein